MGLAPYAHLLTQLRSVKTKSELGERFEEGLNALDIPFREATQTILCPCVSATWGGPVYTVSDAAGTEVR